MSRINECLHGKVLDHHCLACEKLYKALEKPKTVFVVSIPWDSHRVKDSYVFRSEEKAKAFADKVNERGYNGFTGGVTVETLEVME